MQMFLLLALPHWTLGVPATARVPNSTGTATQISWLMVKRQTPPFRGQTSPAVTIGSPQQFVIGVPTCAKGVTVTGTQTVDL